jgi:hypothetical protein
MYHMNSLTSSSNTHSALYSIGRLRSNKGNLRAFSAMGPAKFRECLAIVDCYPRHLDPIAFDAVNAEARRRAGMALAAA